jgi:hypothetical protein
MKTERLKTSRMISYGIALFLLFAAIFSFFRYYIYSFNSWCFAFTGETQHLAPADDGSPDSSDSGKQVKSQPGTVTAPAQKPAIKTSVPKDIEDKPVRSNLPMTSQPKVSMLQSLSNVEESKLTPFPELRLYSGLEWKNEKTLIAMASDGTSLYASFFCYDAEPSQLVTRYSETEGTTSAWKDDSIELFLMKNKESDHYYQFVSSASGLSHVFYQKVLDSGPKDFSTEAAMPKEMIKPFIRSEKCKEGFKVTMEINLQGLGFGKLDDGREILMQIVRNYRDSASPVSAELQLFPTFIYADNRYGAQNHDRRAFAPVKIAK